MNRSTALIVRPTINSRRLRKPRGIIRVRNRSNVRKVLLLGKRVNPILEKAIRPVLVDESGAEDSEFAISHIVKSSS